VKKVLVTEFMDETALESLGRRFSVRYRPGLADERAATLGALADVDALIVRNRTRVDTELIGRAPKLAVLGRLGVGLDNIDLEACRARGIRVIPATGANALAVAEYVVCATMMLLRGAYLATGPVLEGKWPRGALSEGRETAGKVLGVVGFGAIGRLTARLAQALGMAVIGADAAIPAHAPVWRESGVRHATLDEVLAQSDAVTLHVPLTSETRRLIDARRVALMKQGAVLVNTARGGVVDEAALAGALKSGRLGGAALDVFESEPLPAGSALVGAPNLVLTPHIAGVTKESNRRVSAMIAEQVAAALA
jgi:(S)-sulfolactate dehydrogenase